VRVEVLDPLVPDDLARPEQLLLELNEDRRGLIDARVPAPELVDAADLGADGDSTPVSGISWLNPRPSDERLFA